MDENKDFSSYSPTDLVTREDMAAYLNINMTTLANWLGHAYKDVIKPCEGNGGRGGKYKYFFKDAQYFKEHIKNHAPDWSKAPKKDKKEVYIKEERIGFSKELHLAFKLTRDQIVSQIENLTEQRNKLASDLDKIETIIKEKHTALEELINLASDNRAERGNYGRR